MAPIARHGYRHMFPRRHGRVAPREEFEGRTGAGTPNLAEDRFNVAAASRAAPTTLDRQAMHELFGQVVDTAGLEALSGQTLLDELRRRFFAQHVTLDYSTARRLMFTQIDNEGGQVRDVYTGRVLNGVTRAPNPDGPGGFNTEHTWPRSQLHRARKSAAESDLHHLFPSDTVANGKRGSYPFGEVVQVEWERNGAKLGLNATGDRVFTPPPGHRGDVARSMFWISAAYGLSIPEEEEAVLRKWSGEDPVDSNERERNRRIATVQGDWNAFVLEPQLVSQVADF